MAFTLLQGGKLQASSPDPKSSSNLSLGERYSDGYVELIWLDKSSNSPFLQFPVFNNELGLYFCSVLKRILDKTLDEGLLEFHIVQILDWMVLRKKEFLSYGDDKSFFYKQSDRLAKILVQEVAENALADITEVYEDYFDKP